MGFASWSLQGDWASMDAEHVLPWLLLVVVGLVTFGRIVGGPGTRIDASERQLESLRERLLRGEIDHEEFEQSTRTLWN